VAAGSNWSASSTRDVVELEVEGIGVLSNRLVRTEIVEKVSS